MAGAGVRIISVLGLMFALVAAPARAGDDSAGGQAARALIEKQLDAFAHDDAAGAYALAAPALKTIFSDPDVFMAMVRGQYAPVYRHRSVEYGPLEIDGDNVSQVLTIVDDNNQVPLEGALQTDAPARRKMADQRLPAGQIDGRGDLNAPSPRILLDLLRCIIHEHATTCWWSMRAGCVKDVKASSC